MTFSSDHFSKGRLLPHLLPPSVRGLSNVGDIALAYEKRIYHQAYNTLDPYHENERSSISFTLDVLYSLAYTKKVLIAMTKENP